MKRNFLPKRKSNLLPGTPGKASSEQIDSRTECARARSIRPVRPPREREAVRQRIILCVCNDLDFDKRLRAAALARGQIVIRVEAVEAALRIVDTGCAGAVLLDLDFAGKEAWELAGSLLQDPKCPPVILLTGQGEQFDLRMAIMAGSIFEKTENADKILNVVGGLLEAPLADRAHRTMVQRGIIRQFTPAPLIPGQRYWGINE